MAAPFYPPVSTLVSADDMPTGLGFFGSAVSDLLAGLYYRDLQVEHGPEGDNAFYRLTLIHYGRIAFEVPGTGIAIVLNASTVPNEPATFVPMQLHYRWPILKYVPDFDLSTFSFRPEAIFQIALYVAGAASDEVIRVTIEQFVPGGDLGAFVDDMNTSAGLALNVPAAGDDAAKRQALADQIEAQAGVPAASLIYAFYVAVGDDPSRILERTNALFSGLLGGATAEELVKDLLIPRIDAAFDTNVTVEFPRSVLIPLDETPGPNFGKPLPGKASLRFDVGTVEFSTQRGIGFSEELTGEFTWAQIGETGFTVDLDRAKLDLSRTENIPEATEDGRGDDFVGVYIEDASLGLPPKWFKQANGSTAEIFGSKLLIGTGGFSGTLGMRALGNVPQGQVPRLNFRLAGDDGFEISLTEVSARLRQNALTGAQMAGSLKIPGFEDAAGNDAEIGIEITFADDGDFSIAASEPEGFEVAVPDILSLFVTGLELGREDDDLFVTISGRMRFTNPAIAAVLKGDFEIKGLTVLSDGSFRLEGGTLPLPKGAEIQLGPAKVAITAIHFGAYEQEHQGQPRKYSYFGFDGGISLNPGGVDARGDGIKFYYSVDDDPAQGRDPHVFLRIQSLAIDLVIPGTAKPETAVALISGYVSLKEAGGREQYAGGVSLKLPKIQLAGSAEIAYTPSVPAFLVDAGIELAAPLPLGATGLGIYGFRGLLGLRYIASKDAAGVPDEAAWFDWYKKPPLGATVPKFAPPADTADADNPFSVGAGVSLATVGDDGTSFSSKLFLLLSLPELVLLEGKANVLGKRVGLDSRDPPFFAFIALSPNSVELGFGADYKVPDPSGLVLKLYAEVRGGFYFDNPSGWFLNFGTKDQPITAEVLSLFSGHAYLMLSVQGITAGARIEYRFDKSYAGGAVRAMVNLYFEVGGFISFERPQIGGYIMVGGGIDAYFLFVGFNFSVDTTLIAEAPEPFFIDGRVRLCVGVTIGFWKFKKRFEKCFSVKVSWTLDDTVDRTPVIPFADPAELAQKPPVKAINMTSGETFGVVYLGSSEPSGNDARFGDAILPLDSFIDIEFPKGLLPDAVDGVLGRTGEPPANHREIIPPEPVRTEVVHQYAIERLRVLHWSNGWHDYEPFAALAPPAALAALAAQPGAYPVGHWQKMGKGYSKIRLLADTSFSYMEQGETGWHQPERFGHTGATLFCEATRRTHRCADWEEVPPGTPYEEARRHSREGLSVFVVGGPGVVLAGANAFGKTRGLVWDNADRLVVDLPKKAVRVGVKLHTWSSAVRVTFYRLTNPGDPAPVHVPVSSELRDRVQLTVPVAYDDPRTPIHRVVIEPAHADRPIDGDAHEGPTLAKMEVEAERIWRRRLEDPLLSKEERDKLRQTLERLRSEIDDKHRIGCVGGTDDERDELEALRAHVAEMLDLVETQLAGSTARLSGLRRQRKVLTRAIANCLASDPRPLTFELGERANGRLRWRLRDRADRVVLTSHAAFARAEDARADVEKAVALVAERNRLSVTRTGSDSTIRLAAIEGGSLAIGRPLGSSRHSRRLADALANSAERLRVFDPRIVERRFDWGRTTPHTPTAECREHLASGLRGTPPWDEVADLVRTGRKWSPADYARVYRGARTALAWLDARIASEERTRRDLETRLSDLRDGLAAIDRTLSGLASEKGHPKPPWRCSTALYEICWLTEEDHAFNATIPGQAAIQEDFEASRDAVERSLAPIWRPGGTYLLHLEVSDTVDGNPPSRSAHYFGFSTAGPVGHFHDAPGVDYVDAAGGKTADEYPLTSLRTYLDYDRSYPNANGNLLNAKPLPWKDGRLRLFYAPRYAYHLVNGWPAYHGLPEIEGALQILIKDPADGQVANVGPQAPATVHPEAVIDWPRDDDPRMPADLRALRNLANHAGACLMSGGELIRPAAVRTEVTLNHLRPRKLYTAIVNNVFDGRAVEVHRYVFETSRFGSFADQIGSFFRADRSGALHPAIFDEPLVASAADIAAAQALVTDAAATTGSAAERWPDPFERATEGHLRLPRGAPPAGVEILRLRAAGGALRALLVRSPEPFNDPKVPGAEARQAVAVLSGGQADAAYHTLLSKDGASALVVHQSGAVTASRLALRFRYLAWSGSRWQVEAEETLTDLELAP